MTLLYFVGRFLGHVRFLRKSKLVMKDIIYSVAVHQVEQPP